eukprot:CAMPEP_0185034494 /NCGR_PEP_ID=MMETSP1103-20130426/24447_1 /TAXON_ID=36769 /ORGANISM="Paraphysomonas bandaiensis, Strain Caron Lab Isolate" /LENGTH=295 /DNA_ID=CAMNT_0027571173 /DNA_START=69 /DNA_END=953 /DNA_ORIENTATION=-
MALLHNEKLMESMLSASLEDMDGNMAVLHCMLSSAMELLQARIPVVASDILVLLEQLHCIKVSLGQYSKQNKALSAELQRAGCSVVASEKRALYDLQNSLCRKCELVLDMARDGCVATDTYRMEVELRNIDACLRSPLQLPKLKTCIATDSTDGQIIVPCKRARTESHARLDSSLSQEHTETEGRVQEKGDEEAKQRNDFTPNNESTPSRDCLPRPAANESQQSYDKKSTSSSSICLSTPSPEICLSGRRPQTQPNCLSAVMPSSSTNHMTNGSVTNTSTGTSVTGHGNSELSMW